MTFPMMANMGVFDRRQRRGRGKENRRRALLASARAVGQGVAPPFASTPRRPSANGPSAPTIGSAEVASMV